jgi:hypothetical protein
MRLLWFLLVPVLIGWAQPAQAGIFFGRNNKKPEPRERVPELVTVLKTDRDEDKRVHAAEELRQYDPVAFPIIIPALIDALQTDKRPSVRAEAAQSLGKLRPVSEQAGQALEKALAGDASMRVRLQARSSLLQYHWAGYRTRKAGQSPSNKEPPLGNDRVPPLIDTISPPATTPRLVPTPVPSVAPPATTPKPVLPTPANPTPSSPPSPGGSTGSRPASGPDLGSPAPATKPATKPATQAPPEKNEGPELGPPG